jgi:branched-chain amino acid transport system substrate-binding protein
VVIVEPVKKWVFKTPHTDRMAWREGLRRHAQPRRHAGRAHLRRRAGSTARCAPNASRSRASAGVQIVADESYGAGDSDMTARARQDQGDPGVQAVLNAGFGQGPAIVTRNYRSSRSARRYINLMASPAKQFVKLAGDSAEGVRLPAARCSSPRRCRCGRAEEVVASYKREYEARFKQEVSTFAATPTTGS